MSVPPHGVIRRGEFRAEKVQYPDGVGCCLWQVWPGKNEDMGCCFDFTEEELEDIIALLQELRGVEAEPLVMPEVAVVPIGG